MKGKGDHGSQKNHSLDKIKHEKLQTLVKNLNTLVEEKKEIDIKTIRLLVENEEITDSKDKIYFYNQLEKNFPFFADKPIDHYYNLVNMAIEDAIEETENRVLLESQLQSEEYNKKVLKDVARKATCNLVCIEEKIYDVFSSPDTISPWNQFILEDIAKAGLYNDHYKVHVSLERDKENIKKAHKVIIPILASYRIELFKMIYSKAINLGRGGNPDGKELTIYMQIEKTESQESKPDFWIEFLDILERSMVEKGILKGSRPMADSLFPGSRGYIYYRDSYSITDSYIKADHLKELGFTCEEASNLSGKNKEFWGGKRLGGPEQGVSKSELSCEYNSTIEMKNLNIKVDNGFMLKCYEKDIEKIEYLFSWENNTVEEHILLGYFEDINISNQELDDIMSQQKSSDILSKSCLEQTLIKSSVIVAMIHNILPKEGVKRNTKGYIKTGNIAPTIYHHFIVPFITKAKDEKWTPDRMLEELQREESCFLKQEILLKELVKTSLRLRNKKQIFSDYPTYIAQIPEVEVEKLAITAIDFFQSNKSQSPEKETFASRLAKERLRYNEEAKDNCR